MPDYGFVRVCAAVPNLSLGDCAKNAADHLAFARSAGRAKAQLVVFPELSLTGATCGDLFRQSGFPKRALAGLKELVGKLQKSDAVFVAGLPLALDGRLYDSACVFQKGKILGFALNSIPNDRAFNVPEKGFAGSAKIMGQTVRYGTDLVFRSERFSFTVGFGSELNDPLLPLSGRAAFGEITVVMDAAPELAGSYVKFKNVASSLSLVWKRGLVYASSSSGESSTDNYYGGRAFVFEEGRLLGGTKQFQAEGTLTCSDVDCEFLRFDRPLEIPPKENVVDFSVPELKEPKPTVAVNPFVPDGEAERDARCEEIFSIQCGGLARRLAHTKAKRAVIGVSGGLDSTLALLVAREAQGLRGLGPGSILGITMPCFGTSGRTKSNACALMEELGIEFRTIDIHSSLERHFKDISHPKDLHDAAYENAQARERTQILMDVANSEAGLAVGTGDLSEAALGWATYGGDQMAMYNVNCGIPKTLVRAVVAWYAKKVGGKIGKILSDIIATPISPELLPAVKGEATQKTEDSVGPYEIHDFFIYHMLRRGATPGKLLFLANAAFAGRFSPEKIKACLKIFLGRFFSQQFKRSCSPDGVGTGSVSLSPRAGLRMPSDISSAPWLDEV
ncbi:NAD(+) synthase [bacterium]|nr:NAD(+) synthase [bacterium]